MNFDEIKSYVFAEAEKEGLSEYELFSTRDSSISTETLKDEISAFAYGVSGGVSFRCKVDGRMGEASTELLTLEEMRALVKRAASNARNIECDDPAIIYGGSDEYQKTTMPSFVMPEAAELKASALEIQKLTYAENEAVTEGTQSVLFAGEVEMRLVNSKGLDLSNRFGTKGGYVEAVIKKDGESEENFELSDSIDINELRKLPKKAVDGALAKIGAGRVKSGKYDVIFSSKQARALLSTYSDIFSARNAQLGLSLLKGKEGEKIAADCITIYDDPMREGCTAQTPFDGEGVATFKKTVIEDGTLKTLLYDLTTAAKADLKSTGNGQRASYSSPTHIAPYSFYFKAGNVSASELMATVEDGIYITAMKGLHSGADSVTGDFSIDSEGFRIKNGKLAGAVKSFTVAGNFFELLKEVEALADNLEFGLPSGFTTYGAPDILVRQMSIAGE